MFIRSSTLIVKSINYQNLVYACFSIIFSNLPVSTPMAEYRNIIDQKDYCDESDLLVAEYDNYPAVQFQAELEFITKWAGEESSAPLVIVGEAESGKKTLLCEFLKASKRAHPGWLHLSHFSSITPHYSHILYRTMIALRNHFKVEQRVDLNDEKLRRYFKYWLEVASDFIEKQYLGYLPTEVPKVVIIIEDVKGNLVETEFWLPNHIPKNVKLILTTKCFRDNEIAGATVLRHYLSHEKKAKIYSRFQEKTRSISSKSDRLSLYHLQLINQMVKIKPNFQPNGTNIQQIVQEYISSVSVNGFSSEEIKSILYILTLTRKGLKQKWIQKIVNVSQQKWGLFYRFFSFFIVESNSYYIICNKTARQITKTVVDCTGEKEKTYRHSISHSIRNQAVHLRELEEIVHQLYLSESYSELKEVISRVENFAMLYTPLSKDLLCQSWVKLEQLEQYDPVFEYNKAIQAYKSHYYPKEEDLYKIIFQISMFFKEYAQFENARTPQFRHPLIKGQIDQLVEIGIYQELKSLAMIGKLKVYKLKPIEKFSSLPKKTETSLLEAKKQKQTNDTIIPKPENEMETERKIASKTKPKEKKEAAAKPRESVVSTSDPSRPDTSSSKDEEGQLQAEPALNIEELNVSILANQQKFRAFFTNSMKEYLENYFAPLKKGNFKEKQLSFQSDDSQNDEQAQKEKMERQLKIIEVQKLKQELILKKFREYLQESYHKTGEEVSFYYYKQWIWLQFPWICQTVKNVYSQMIKECLPGSIHFMSPLQEFKFVREVLKIARTAKESKMNIYTEKKIQVLPLKYSPEKLDELRCFRKSKGTYDQCESRISRTKRPNEFQASKESININNIDELIYNEKQFEQTFKQKHRELLKGLRGQASTPNLNMFVTEAADKSKMFPALIKSKFAKQTRSNNREKQNLDNSKDYTMVIRKFNEIKHENDMLVQKIEEMKRLSSIQMTKTKEEHDTIIYHIRNIEERKEILEKNFNHQSLLQKKLEVIIKICDLNKMYGSESEYLSTYLASLKQMIQLEENRIKDIKQRLADFLQVGKGEVKELKKKRKELKILKEEHDKMYINLGQQIRTMPLEEIEEEPIEIQRIVKTKSKKEKSKKERYFSTEDYDFLEEQFGLIFGDNQNELKLKQFSDKAEKKKQLHLKNNELREVLKKEKESLLIVQEKLKNLDQANLNEKKLHVSNELIEKKKALNQLRHRSHLLEEALLDLSQKQ